MGQALQSIRTIESLGKELDLPPFLEGKRAEIEAKLEPIE